MNADIRKYHLAGAILVFVALPAALFGLGEVPRRTLLKEAFSLLTVLAFALLLGQFFLARSNRYFVRAFRFSSVLGVHKAVGYSVVGVFLVHPVLVVLPRYFEGGVSPFDALVTLVTTFGGPGVVQGLIAWGLILLIGATSLFRERLNIGYPAWKVLHGVLSILLIIIATWHAIELGRHMDGITTAFVIVLASAGVVMLLSHYAPTTGKTVGGAQGVKQ